MTDHSDPYKGWKNPWKNSKTEKDWGQMKKSKKKTKKKVAYSERGNDYDERGRKIVEEVEKDGPVEISAELSRKVLNAIHAGDITFCLPPGVDLRHKAGSRCLYMTCENKATAEVLTDALDLDRIVWSEG